MRRAQPGGMRSRPRTMSRQSPSATKCTMLARSSDFWPGWRSAGLPWSSQPGPQLACAARSLSWRPAETAWRDWPWCCAWLKLSEGPAGPKLQRPAPKTHCAPAANRLIRAQSWPRCCISGLLTMCWAWPTRQPTLTLTRWNCPAPWVTGRPSLPCCAAWAMLTRLAGSWNLRSSIIAWRWQPTADSMTAAL